ncbi:hypothetical protein [Mesorhizobium sp. M0146]|uniref:hypothetical protein n=1 Tax=unclassified Mesorhizobium TaxID=325217 RepID=UPI00333D7B06
MASLIFVHGTGVRAAGYAQALGFVQKAMQGSGLTVVEALWGDRLGVKLLGDGASIPSDEQTLAIGDSTPEDEAIALWSLLYDDPLYELRLYEATTRGSSNQGAFIPGRLTPAATLEKGLQSILQTVPGGSIDVALEESGLTGGALTKAAQAVKKSSAYAAVLLTLREPLGPFRSALARAIVARMVLDQATSGESKPGGQMNASSVSLDGATRDRLVSAIAIQLGPAELGIGSWLLGHLGGLAQRWGTNHVLRNRRTLSDLIYPGVGDILRYQVRGDEVRKFVLEQIKAAEAPVVILGHSLGGIICADLLIQHNLSREVKLLVTVGSQAPFLYEMDVLPGLRWKEELPSHFPRWLNIYDRRDFLSYIGDPVFPGRVTDRPINSRQPFPQAHSAYFNNADTWNLIREEWKAASET